VRVSLIGIFKRIKQEEEVMTGRERVKKAMHFQPADKVPVQYYYTPVGYYEHGEKLNDLYAALPGDFEPYPRMPIPVPGAADYDSDGSFHAFHRDEWGTLWEYRILGITGIPKEYPLADIAGLEEYCLPAFPALTGPEFEAYRAEVSQHQLQYYYLQRAGSLFEKLIALRPEEDVLCDIALDEPGINRLADRIIEYNASFIHRAISAKADGVSFGDDYGTEHSLIMSPDTWRGFIKPRLKEMFAPAVKAGLDIHFHSCGQISSILEDLREIGVTSIWPQIPAYNMELLAEQCRSLGLAVAVHTDRARTMTYGTPKMVHDLVMKEYETFRMRDGGAWFYVEADNGFPFDNLKALIDTIADLR
jgi:hypothetical protein